MRISTMIKKQKELARAIYMAADEVANEKVKNNVKDQSHEDFTRKAEELSNKHCRLSKALIQVEEVIRELELI